MVVGEFTSFGGEAQVGDGWDFEVGNLEALRPFVLGLVLEFKAEILLLEVGEAGSGCDLGVANATGLVQMSECVLPVCDKVHTEQPATSLDFPSLSLS